MKAFGLLSLQVFPSCVCKLMKICMNDPASVPKFDMIVPILEKMQDK